MESLTAKGHGDSTDVGRVHALCGTVGLLGDAYCSDAGREKRIHEGVMKLAEDPEPVIPTARQVCSSGKWLWGQRNY